MAIDGRNAPAAVIEFAARILGEAPFSAVHR